MEFCQFTPACFVSSIASDSWVWLVLQIQKGVNSIYFARTLLMIFCDRRVCILKSAFSTRSNYFSWAYWEEVQADPQWVSVDIASAVSMDNIWKHQLPCSFPPIALHRYKIALFTVRWDWYNSQEKHLNYVVIWSRLKFSHWGSPHAFFRDYFTVPLRVCCSVLYLC